MISENVENQLGKSICESCGEEFLCGANVGKCWCFEVDLEKENLEKLQEDFENCLCKNCLIKYGKKEKQNFKRQAH